MGIPDASFRSPGFMSAGRLFHEFWQFPPLLRAGLLSLLPGSLSAVAAGPVIADGVGGSRCFSGVASSICPGAVR